MSRKKKRRRNNTGTAAKKNAEICTSHDGICIYTTKEYAEIAYQPAENRQKEKKHMDVKKKELKARKSGKYGPNKRMLWRGKNVLMISIMAVICIMMMTVPAFASGESGAAGDPITVVNNLNSFIFGLIRAIGIILLGWGIVQVGLSFQSHDPSQRSNGFLTLAGGLVITFAKEILNLIAGV